MNIIVSLIHKISNRLTRLRLRPIQVYCLHHVSKHDNPLLFCKGDWISEDCFHESILLLKERGYRFISLTEAWSKINYDFIRYNSYVVLTFDDGYRSSLPTFHWLEEQGIPYTIFLNARYLDGVSLSQHIVHHAQSVNPTISEKEISKDLYLTVNDLKELSPLYSEFGSHGYEHVDATCIQTHEFRNQLKDSIASLSLFSQFVPFHAYTWGRHTIETDHILREEGFTAVLMDGAKNYNSPLIHRQLFPSFDSVSFK